MLRPRDIVMMGVTVLLFVIAISLPTIADANSDYLVCKPISNFFIQDGERNATRPRGPKGPQGKRGPPGLIGPSGPPGPVGPPPVIDWDVIDQHVKVLLETKVGCLGVTYGQHCYKLLHNTQSHFGGHGKVNASNQCSRAGGELVDIETSEMYHLLYAYIKKTWLMYVDSPSTYYVAVWLASSYATGELRSSGGAEVYAKWYGSGPAYNSPAVRWIVATDQSSRIPRNTGMQSVNLKDRESVPFCRFSY